MHVRLAGLMLLIAFQAEPIRADLPGGLTRAAGTDPANGIDYVLLSTYAKPPDGSSVTPAPRLTAQCTRQPGGKMKFELLADFGGVTEVRFISPWKSTKETPLAPYVPNTLLKMEFLGYMKVKPKTMQWKLIAEIPGEMRYGNPGISSSNLEEAAYQMQFLKALPTLRLSAPGRPAVEWETSKWLAAVKAEPMCGAAGL